MRAKAPARGILFVGHDAARAGAQIELLHFLRWFKRHGSRTFSVLLGRGGELVPDFQQLAHTWPVERSRWRPDARRSHLLVALGHEAWTRRAQAAEVGRFVAKNPPALIYANSIASADIIKILNPKVAMLTHVHELEIQIGTNSTQEMSDLLSRTSQFIACSNAARENLLKQHTIPAAKVETVHESIPVADVRADRTRQQVFQELGIPSDAQLIIGSGTLGWRKGADLFIQVARAVTQHHKRAYFAWVGGGWHSDTAQFEHDIRLAGLGERVRLTGGVQKPYDYMAACDVFVLTSREDPYPLVCLEAAALEKPIICFADAGGMPEFVEDDCGFVVSYLDITAMADRVVSLLDAPNLRHTMGTAALQKVTQRHDINVAAPRILEIIERTIHDAKYSR